MPARFARSDSAEYVRRSNTKSWLLEFATPAIIVQLHEIVPQSEQPMLEKVYMQLIGRELPPEGAVQ